MKPKIYHFSSQEEKLIERIVDQKEVQINHIILPRGDKLPEHHSNSNVYLITIQGKMSLTLEGEKGEYVAGNIIQIPYQTRMLIENQGEEILEFLVVKAPHPEQYKN
ncbi:MAG: cupin domain-containing protein [Candidatus Atribacteria bacterium]|nr:cupin domain-containing protein [Candidatus Atribacteria bacterium]MCD6349584.1 cupin domain-containing protein [Candidatus Atribacteria bacterium]